MPVKSVIFAIALIITVSFIVYLTETLVPLSVKSKMNTYCRNALLGMEIDGRLTEERKQELIDILEEIGLDNIQVAGTQSAPYGGSITLSVEADYTQSRLTGLLYRKDTTYHMEYRRSAIARRVIN